MARPSLTLLGLAAAVSLSACNPPNIAGAPLKPTTTGEAFHSQVECSAVRPSTEPSLMAWEPDERANLNAIRQQGLVVVRYAATGCNVELEVLSNCDAPGSYRYFPANPASNSIVANNATELYGKLPLGAAQFASQLHGDRALRTDWELVGVDKIPIGTVVRKSELRGDCQGATHVISEIYLGAFRLDAGDKRRIDAAVTLFGAGAGGNGVAGVEHLESQGNLKACQKASTDGKEERGCSVPLRIALLPLGAPTHDCPQGSKGTGSGCQVSQVNCPAGTRWNGSACTARVDTNCAAGLHFASGQGCVPDSTAPVAVVQPAAHPGKMVRIPAGTFEMGSPAGVGNPDEHPQHKVHVKAFHMDLTEVTVAQYAACVAAGNCPEAPTTVDWTGIKPLDRSERSRLCNGDRADRANHPENCVDWNMASDYCRWIGGRLPTEQEWEYTARGTAGRTYPWGNQPPGPSLLNACGPECHAALQHIGWHLNGRPAMYATSDGWGTTAPVASYPAGRSPFGLYDMAGNVYEWTSSDYCRYPSTNCTTKYRVVRGGSWLDSVASWVRAAHRLGFLPSHRYDYLGFRCAR